MSAASSPNRDHFRALRFAVEDVIYKHATVDATPADDLPTRVRNLIEAYNVELTGLQEMYGKTLQQLSEVRDQRDALELALDRQVGVELHANGIVSPAEVKSWRQP